MWQRKWKYKGPHNKIFSISHIPSVLSFSFLSRKENVWQRKLYKLCFFMKECHAWNVGATIFNYLMWCLHLNQKVQLILENEGRIRNTILKKVQIQFSDFCQRNCIFEVCLRFTSTCSWKKVSKFIITFIRFFYRFIQYIFEWFDWIKKCNLFTLVRYWMFSTLYSFNIFSLLFDVFILFTWVRNLMTLWAVKSTWRQEIVKAFIECYFAFLLLPIGS